MNANDILPAIEKCLNDDDAAICNAFLWLRDGNETPSKRIEMACFWLKLSGKRSEVLTKIAEIKALDNGRLKA